MPVGATAAAPAVRVAVTLPPVGVPSMQLRGGAVMVDVLPGSIPVGPGVAVGSD